MIERGRGKGTMVVESSWRRIMGRLASIIILGFLAVACSTEPDTQITTDVSGDSSMRTEVATEVCTPQCDGKACGDDGCGGLCGDPCGTTLKCSDAGLCEPYLCQSSKDCPGELICDAQSGQCVICVGDEDCPEDKVCGADHECHASYPCSSDKECKDYGLICDKEAGVCVECLDSTACDPSEYCLDRFCLADECEGGKSVCDGDVVLTCIDDGSGWEQSGECGKGEYCLEGECLDEVCVPGELFCDDNWVKECNGEGSAAEPVEQCQEGSQICANGACVDLACEPGTTWCKDDLTAAACSSDGTQITEAPCPADYYCEEGQCLAMVCEPGDVFCDGDIYKVCNGNGSAVQYEEDCTDKDQHCYEGMCIDTVCPADQLFCLDDVTTALCAADGMDYTPQPCAAQHYCEAGQCLPWVCEPASVLCDGNAVVVCNGKGSALQSTTDCAALVCIGGECKDQICAADAAFCDGTVVKQCDESGTQAEVVQTCDESQYCAEDGMSATCEEQVCTTGAKSCQDTLLMLCDEVGASLEQVKDCKDEEKACLDGECVEQECGNGVIDEGEECDDGNDDLCDGCEGCLRRMAAYLDGENPHRIEVYDVVGNPLDISDSFTVEFWMKLNSSEDSIAIFHRKGAGWSLRVWDLGGIYVGVSLFSGGSEKVYNYKADNLTYGEWHHLAWSYDGEKYSGVQADGKLGWETLPYNISPSSGNTTMIGAEQNHLGQFVQSTSARIDELRVSDVVRYGGTPFTPARRFEPDEHTIGLWHFDEGQGDVIVDSSDKAHPGTGFGVIWEPDGCYGSSPDSAVCGDGKEAVWEDCDDGNNLDGDGCSSVCTL